MPKKTDPAAPQKPSRSPSSADEHMARRQGSGLSIREIAAEFGTSKSTAHRRLKNSRPGSTGNALRDGFTTIKPGKLD